MSSSDARRPTVQRRGRRTLASEPWLVVSSTTALRHSARGVNPMTSPRIKGQAGPRPSVFSGEQMLVRGALAPSAAFSALQKIAKASGLEPEIDARDQRIAERLAALQLPGLSLGELVCRVVLRTAAGSVSAAPDPWLLLQTYRSQGADKDPYGVALDHLIGLHEHVNGSPFIAALEHVNGSPVLGGLEHVNGSPSQSQTDLLLSEYGLPGHGGRTPTGWAGRPPNRIADDLLKSRRPVVALLDTGCGSHPWLDDVVTRYLGEDGLPLGEIHSDDVANPMTGELDEDSGHGTFIAGLIRQTCPDADILAARIMGDDGVVTESDLIRALYLLLIRQVGAFRDQRPDRLMDVLCLSLGYYHEQAGDQKLDPMLLAPIRALGRHGVTVVASAGNQATDRPVYPAAFAPHQGGPVPSTDADMLPVISVGATNPDGSIALFSNGGPWVLAYRLGAALVSTMPINLDGGLTASVITTGPAGNVRATIDPDDFKGGFGTWSGTSFAAPVLAGEVLQNLIDGGSMEPVGEHPVALGAQPVASASEAPQSVEEAVRLAVSRGWTAVERTMHNDISPLRRP
jgi:hypothetical protein